MVQRSPTLVKNLEEVISYLLNTYQSQTKEKRNQVELYSLGKVLFRFATTYLMRGEKFRDTFYNLRRIVRLLRSSQDSIELIAPILYEALLKFRTGEYSQRDLRRVIRRASNCPREFLENFPYLPSLNIPDEEYYRLIQRDIPLYYGYLSQLVEKQDTSFRLSDLSDMLYFATTILEKKGRLDFEFYMESLILFMGYIWRFGGHPDPKLLLRHTSTRLSAAILSAETSISEELSYFGFDEPRRANIFLKGLYKNTASPQILLVSLYLLRNYTISEIRTLSTWFEQVFLSFIDSIQKIKEEIIRDIS